jgi:hypothetical protein
MSDKARAKAAKRTKPQTGKRHIFVFIAIQQQQEAKGRIAPVYACKSPIDSLTYTLL